MMRRSLTFLALLAAPVFTARAQQAAAAP